MSTDVRIKLEALKGCPKGFLNVCLPSLCTPCIKQPNALASAGLAIRLHSESGNVSADKDKDKDNKNKRLAGFEGISCFTNELLF